MEPNKRKKNLSSENIPNNPSTQDNDAEKRTKHSEHQKNYRERKKQKTMEHLTATTPTTVTSTSGDTTNVVTTPEVIPPTPAQDKEAKKRRKQAEYQRTYRERKKQKTMEVLTPTASSTSTDTTNVPTTPEIIPPSPAQDTEAERRRQNAEYQRNCRERKKRKTIEALTPTASSTSADTTNVVTTPEVIPPTPAQDTEAERRRKNAEYQRNCRERKKRKTIEALTPTASSTSADTTNVVTTPEVIPPTPAPDSEADKRSQKAEHQRNYRERKKQKTIEALTPTASSTSADTTNVVTTPEVIPPTPAPDSEADKRSQKAEHQRNYRERKKQKTIEALTPTASSTSADTTNVVTTPEVIPPSPAQDNEAKKRSKKAEHQRNYRERNKQKNLGSSTESTPLRTCSTSFMNNNIPDTPSSLEPNTGNIPACRRVLFPEHSEQDNGNRKWERRLKSFLTAIKQGPTFVCSCCGGLFYKKSVTNVSRDKLLMWKLNSEVIPGVLHVQQDQHYLCSNCHLIVKRKQIPRMALSKGLDFPVIPSVLKDLTQLEERLVAPRLPFMQIRLTGFERQWSMRGNVVNVESDLNICVNSLPRRFDQAAVVQLKLMRRMQYTRPYLYDKIRPAKVMAALRHLINTPLYIDEGVTMTENWDFGSSGEVDFNLEEDGDGESSSATIENETIEEMNGDTEEQEPGDEQTLLHIDDLASVGIKIAPAEGKTPMPFFRDANAEYLSFPSIYCGQRPTYPAKVSYTDIVKSELRRYDRRCAVPEKILFSYKKSFNERVRDAFQICLRQKPSQFQGERVTAGRLRDNAYIKNLISKDDGYAVYKQVRTTPAYWKAQCRKVTSMIRQLGQSTFFITLSAAETRWPELLSILSNVVDRQPVGYEDALNLDRDTRARLIRSDPVTCMRHFDHKAREFLKNLIKPKDGVFSPHGVEDWYSRIEFQMRGSPHSHGLYWLPNAPRYDPNDPDSASACIDFIDKYITCRRTTEGELGQLIGYQLHRHTHTCKKQKRTVRKCRFNYPKPPMPRTCILDPLPSDMTRQEKDDLSKSYTDIENYLNRLGRNFEDEMNFEDFLQKLNMSHHNYINAVRSSIKRTTVFLKRCPNESFINAYNEKILLAWQANMDIQFVLDGYACAKYVASYISKSGGGVSKLLRAAESDHRDGNTRITEKLEKFARILIDGSEISAQEAAAFCLGIHMTSCSRSDIFVNTALSGDRVRMLKPNDELETLPDDSEDIYVTGAAARYASRPLELENVCFAEFVTSYVVSTRKGQNVDHEDPEIEDDGTEEIEIVRDQPRYSKRHCPKILRFCNYSRGTHPADYWREQLHLFLPWRNEQEQIEQLGNYESHARENEEIIIKNSQSYYYLRRDISSLDAEGVDFDLPSVEEDNLSDDEENVGTRNEDETQQLAADSEYTREGLTGRPARAFENFLPPKLIENEKYYDIMRSLNDKQRRIVLEVLHLLKVEEDPFYIFLSGGAGVGKSHVVTAIVQSYLRFTNKLSQVSPDALPVIVCAPTGKAAFNVFGMTMHCVFRLPPTEYSGDIAPMEESLCNTLRVKYRNTELFIIDEISMVSSVQLKQVDRRLRQIFDSSKKFGGKSLLVVGHMRQLTPVIGSSVFVPPELRGREAIRSSLVRLNPLWEDFRLFELDEIMRQRGELAFCKALNNMAEGTMDEEDIRLIKSREVREDVAPADAVWLFRTNTECLNYNNKYHATLQTESASSVADDLITGDASELERQLFAETAKTFKQSECSGLQYLVKLQIGGIYFVTCNVDTSDGLFNGSTGVLKAIEYGVRAGSLEKFPTTGWIEFCHPCIGQNIRSTTAFKSRVAKKAFPTGWTPIDRISRVLNKKYKGMQVNRKQIPLQAANGMTICKSQGSSLAKVVVCLEKVTKRDELYVACSRSTSLEGLFIVGRFVPPAAAGPEDRVTVEMERLRRDPLQFRLLFRNDSTGTTTAYYHNVEGFLVHRQDIVSDPHVMSHDMLFFVEPRVSDSATVSLPGYKLHFRSNSSSQANHFNSEGVLLFVKETAEQPTNVKAVTRKIDHRHCLLLVGKIRNVNFICVYRHPEFPKARFLELLSSTLQDLLNENTVVFGDANFDLKNPSNNSLVDTLTNYNFLPRLPTSSSTTDYNTHLDICFSNKLDLQVSVYENYYSYHKPLSMDWK